MAYTVINPITPGAGGSIIEGVGQAGLAGGAGTGLSFSNDGHTFLYVETTAGTPNVVVEAQSTFKGFAISGDQTQALAVGSSVIIGPFDKEIFDTTSGVVQMNFTGGNETAVLVRAFRQ